MEKLDGKVAVVTGAGKGIGRAIALAYAAQGMKVFALSRTQTDVDATVSEIAASGGQAMAAVCDVTDYEGLAAAMQAVFDRYGRLDVVVINAGTDCEKQPVDQLEIAEWNRVIGVNLNGAFYTARAAIPYLKRTGAGKIILIGSGMGHKGRPGGAPYSCSKAGLWMLTRILAQELAEHHISVNELIPGPVVTDMGTASQKDGQSAFSIGGEWIKAPEEVTDLAVFLAGQPAVGPTAQSFSLMRRDL